MFIPPSRFGFLSILSVVFATTLAAVVAGCGSSATVAAVPTSIIVAAPAISVPTGTYTSTQQVALSDSTQGSTIYYTTDGTIPASSSTPYQGPISIAVSSTIQAIAILNGAQSAVAASMLTIARPPQPKTLTFIQQPTSVPASATLSPAVEVGVQDESGNIDASATNAITLALVGGAGLTGTLTVPAQNGIATFGHLSVSFAGSAYMLTASSPGLATATSASFAVSPIAPPAAALVFSQQPSNSLTTSPISPAIAVTFEDANGNTVTTASNPVTLALRNGTGLTGTLSAMPSNGVAIFNDITVNTPGSYMLSATSAGLTSATSINFNITAPISNGTTINHSMPTSISAFPGGTFEITYSWVAMPVGIAASVFVDFVDSTGAVQFHDNTQPPTSPSQWTGPVSYTHTITVPSNATAGKYTIVAGLRSADGDILLVAGSGVAQLANARYQIGTLTIAPTCSITTFGAVGDGVTDNLTSIQTTLDSASTNQCIALVPAGTFAYSGSLNATGIAVTGQGAASVLKPLSLTNEAMILGGSGSSISNLVMVSSATSRLLSPQSGMIWVKDADNYYVENVLINASSSTGILSQNSRSGYVLNNTIENTLADSISQTLGSYDITIAGNRILNSGDDGISNNSYVVDPSTVHSIMVHGNTIMNNKGGRGMEVSGGTNISFEGNYVDNLDGYTDMYIASESEFNTQSVDNVIISGNTFLDGGPNQGSASIYNSQAGATTITNVTVDGNQFVNPKLAALEFVGNGSESALLIESNIDYSTGAFSTNSNPDASPSITGNQVLAPSSYTTPLVPAGGGCSFAGC